MEGPRITTGQFASGLKYVHRQMPGAMECCGLTVNAGSRDETNPADHGLAHFVEHTIFKGTPRRTSSYIVNRMEAVGGELNAFTTKEETTVYSTMPAGNFERATRLIGELTSESCFPQKGIDLEREVVCDEVDSYLDIPSEAIYDLYDERMFAGNPLAHNILGTEETVKAITGERCRSYLRESFCADNAVYFYVGPQPADKVLRVAEKAFAALPSRSQQAPRVMPEPVGDFADIEETGAHQTHALMGCRIGGLHSPERHVVSLAVNLLGGPGMNSLLNMSLRERRGLVYTVEASTALFSDCGSMTIYFGCDHRDLRKCQRLVSETLQKLAEKPLSESKLESHKRQYLGQLTLGHDNKEQLIISSARALLHGLQPPTLQRTTDLIRAITPAQLQQVAAHLAFAPLRTLILQ